MIPLDGLSKKCGEARKASHEGLRFVLDEIEQHVVPVRNPSLHGEAGSNYEQAALLTVLLLDAKLDALSSRGYLAA